MILWLKQFWCRLRTNHLGKVRVREWTLREGDVLWEQKRCICLKCGAWLG